LTEPQPASSPKTNLAEIFSAVAVIGICLFSHLGALGLVGPDEPRYAWIARAMAQTGDWVTPRLYGSPWFEKPILYYWAAALGFALRLPAEWAARLPSAIAALAAALAIAWLGKKHYGSAQNQSGDHAVAISPALLAPMIFSWQRSVSRAPPLPTCFSALRLPWRWPPPQVVSAERARCATATLLRPTIKNSPPELSPSSARSLASAS
jgi:4-amino-4-deoxy-L-arabinose transferase-like glycosyltransferase